jgi:hypothetical protein
MQLRSKCLSHKPIRYFGLVMPVMAVFFVSSLFAQPIMRWDSLGVNLRQGYNIFWNQAKAQDPVSGDMVVAWSDCRTGDRDIYAQKINQNGVLLWGRSGKQIVQAISHQENPQVIYAGDGNWIFAWVDWRLTPEEVAGKGIYQGDIFAQKVNSNGNPLWNPAAIAVCTAWAGQENIRLVSDGSGGVIVIWQDQRASYCISAQHVTSTGDIAPGWPSDGLSITGTNWGYYPAAVTDGRGGTIIAWEGYGASYDIYAQRVTPEGDLLWGANGQVICNYSGYQYQPQLCTDGQGGAYIVWHDDRSESYEGDVYFQRVDSTGNPYYEVNGRVLCNAPNYQQHCYIIPADGGGAIFCWQDFRNNPNNSDGDIYAQKVDTSGIALWGANGYPVCTADENQQLPGLISDGEGGAIIGWSDNRLTGNNDYDIYAQRISFSGTQLWTTDGTVVCNANNQQNYVILNSDLEHGAFFFWTDNRNGSIGIYEQHLNSSSNLNLQPNGVLIHYGISGDAWEPHMVQTIPGQVLVAWLDDRYSQYYYTNLFIQLLDSSGTPLLAENGRVVSADSIYWGGGDLQLASDLQQGGLLVWPDHHYLQAGQIYAQRIDSRGNVLWAEGGVHVYSINASQQYPRVAGDGTGGAFVVWSGSISSYNYHVYAQRLNANGIQIWGQPVQLSFGSSDEDDCCYGAIPDGEGGVLVVWVTGPWPNFYILAQKLSPSGDEVWQSGGIRVTNVVSRQEYPTMIADGSGGAVIVWRDQRDLVNYNLFAQRIDRFGNYVWPDSGLSVCDVPGDKWDANLVQDCNGNVFVLWDDYRNGYDEHLYLQKITLDGELTFPPSGVPVCIWSIYQVSPKMVSDTRDGVYITWESYPDTFYYGDIYCAHINGAGQLVEPTRLWQPTGNIVCNALFDQNYPAIAQDGAGGCIIAWDDARAMTLGGTDPELFAQRVNDGTITSGIGNGITAIPYEFRLEQNYPNPFNPTTRINYSLAQGGHVYLIIYDILGRKVCTLQNQFMTAGIYHVIWNGEASSGDPVASGVYFYKLQAPGHSQVRKMVLLK